MQLELKTRAFEIKATDEKKGTFRGRVAAFHNLDDQGDIYAKGAFLDGLDFYRTYGVVRDEHQVTTGKITGAEETPEGLDIEGKVSDTQAGRDQLTLLRDGVYKFMSIGAKNSGRYLSSPEEIKAYWDLVGYTPSDEEMVRSAYGARLITKAKPYEASTTFMPANDHTAIHSVKSAAAGGQLRLAEHVALSVDQIEELTQRIRDCARLRGESGRALGMQTKSAVRRLRRTVHLLGTALRGPEAKEPPAAAAQTKSDTTPPAAGATAAAGSPEPKTPAPAQGAAQQAGADGNPARAIDAEAQRLFFEFQSICMQSAGSTA